MTTPEMRMGSPLPAFALELLSIGMECPPSQSGGRLTESDLHAYCPNKAALAQALWRTAVEEFDHHASTLSQLKDPIEAIKTVGTAYARFALEKPARFQDLFQLDNVRLATELNNDPSHENTYRMLLQWVSEAIERGLLLRDDPELIAQTLWAGIHGVINLVNSWNDLPFKPQEMLVSSMFETLMVGVLADRAATGVSR